MVNIPSWLMVPLLTLIMIPASEHVMGAYAEVLLTIGRRQWHLGEHTLVVLAALVARVAVLTLDGGAGE